MQMRSSAGEARGIKVCAVTKRFNSAVQETHASSGIWTLRRLSPRSIHVLGTGTENLLLLRLPCERETGAKMADA